MKRTGPETRKNRPFIDFDSVSPDALRQAVEPLEKQLDALLTDACRQDSRQYLHGVHQFLDAIDITLQPALHLIKVTAAPDLEDACRQFKASTSAMFLRLITHPAFEDHVLNSHTPLSDVVYQRYRDILKRRAQLHLPRGTGIRDAGYGKPMEVIHRVREHHNALESLQLKFRRDVTRASVHLAADDHTLTHDPNRSRRRDAWYRKNTRTVQPDYDTRDCISQQLRIRQYLAADLGFSNFAELMATQRAAGSVASVGTFLTQIADRVIPAAADTLDAIEAFAGENDASIHSLAPWDLEYWTRRYIGSLLGTIEDTDLHGHLEHYFELSHCLNVILDIIRSLFGMTARERHDLPAWAPEVRIFDWFDENNAFMGRQYLDLLARPGRKSIGAWKSTIFHGSSDPETPRFPVCGLQCNFPQPADGAPVCLRLNQVRTLFHEFGHCLHELACRLPLSGLGGTQVDRDVLEFPSGFMERFSNHPAVLARLGKHHATGESLPDSMITALDRIHGILKPLDMQRRLILSQFDVRLHTSGISDPDDVHALYRSVENKYGRGPFPEDAWPETAFHHIFAGNYAFGYYGYLYSGIFADAAFQVFRSNPDPVHSALGRRFLRTILSRGNADAMPRLLENFLEAPMDTAAIFATFI